MTGAELARSVQRFLPDDAATALLGDDIALSLKPGDLVLLKGDLGAGKTSLARAIIRKNAGNPHAEVPSPTYTLVQAYDGRVPLRHYDLYRLSSPDELDELGLEESLTTGVALIEWPERAEGRLPPQAVTIELSHRDAGRLATMSGEGATFQRLARSMAMRDFLVTAGWGEAERNPLAGDASARAYETVALSGEPIRLSMNSPRLVLGPSVRDGKPYAEIAHTAQTVAAFVGLDRALAASGVTVPKIYAADLEQGFLLIEHLGSGHFLVDGKPVVERYAAAAELLATMHKQSWPDAMPTGSGPIHYLPPFDRDAMMIEVELLPHWYVPYATGKEPGQTLIDTYVGLWNAALDRIANCEKSLLLRDYHSPNIVWRPERHGHDRLGVLDFQDAMRGPTAYDLASLAMDARVDVSSSIERATFEAYCAARGADFDRDAFELAFATMAAQRNSKILGIFVRLDRRDGKPQYLKLLPRIRDYLSRALAHPGLAELRRLYSDEGFIGDATA